MPINEDQRERYSRQIILPEIGLAGQDKLFNGRVLLVGAGGLGCSAGLYLAAAGVGTIGIMDGDKVELSNLQRQVAHSTPDIDKPKVDSLAEKMRAINKDVNVVAYQQWLTAENALAILNQYDFIIDCTDNLASKFLIADACHFANKPYCHAGIREFHGQLMTVLPGRTTCYRCVFNAQPPSDTDNDRLPNGVLGAIAGTIGTLQAAEALKFFLGKGELITGRMLTYDGLRGSFRNVNVSANPHCPLCGNEPVITRILSEAGKSAPLG